MINCIFSVLVPIAQFLAYLVVAGMFAFLIMCAIIAVGGDIMGYIEQKRESEYGQADN